MDSPGDTPGNGTLTTASHTLSVATSLYTPPEFSSLPPELCRIVFSYLFNKALARCTRVSKSWNNLCTPILWRELSIVKPHHRWCFATKVARQAVVKNGEHVRELTLHYLSLLDLFATPQNDTLPNICRYMVHCTNLRTVYISTVKASEYFEVEGVDAMVIELLEHNPLLQSLTIAYRRFSKQLVQKLTESLAPSLRNIYLASMACPSGGKYLLENLPETIQTVSMGIWPEDDDKDYVHPQNTGELRPHHSLESVLINGPFDGYQEYVLFPFLGSCSESLKEFNCPDSVCYYNERIRGALAKLGTPFDTLHIGELPQGYESTDAEIAQVISSNPQLISIDIHRCDAGELTTVAILNNISNLGYLNVQCCWGLSSSLLNSILCAARNLKSIIFMDQSFNGDEIVVLHAHDVVASEWACTSLEEFYGMIDVPRPIDMGELGDENDVLITIEDSRRLQQGVYRQLARLTKLQYLNLGQVCCPQYQGDVDNVVQTDCLEMSLESGVEELASLKELRLLNVSNMDQRITRAERQWMDSVWPDLVLRTRKYPLDHEESGEEDNDSDGEGGGSDEGDDSAGEGDNDLEEDEDDWSEDNGHWDEENEEEQVSDEDIEQIVTQYNESEAISVEGDQAEQGETH
ncbi:hypothetical protein BGZ81_002223 [Podila clonocystis]|nr:hypothetical protein BGZ81_002223 [Podila clonocystis]